MIIPQENIKHLMLREEIVDAVRQELFSVYAVQDIDQAIAVLTGVDPGERGADDRFPEESVNGKVERKLFHYALAKKQFGEQESGDEDE